MTPQHSDERRAQPQRRLSADRGIAEARLSEYPTANRDHAPAADAGLEQERRLRTTLTDSQVLVTGIRAGHGALVVNRWAGRPAAGWTLDWYNVELREDGFPYGALLYRDNTNPRRGVRIGVQWRHDIEQLDAVALHETDPRPADNAPDAVLRDLERDARGRLGSLLTIYTAVAVYLATGEAETTILDAAGLSRDG